MPIHMPDPPQGHPDDAKTDFRLAGLIARILPFDEWIETFGTERLSELGIPVTEAVG